MIQLDGVSFWYDRSADPVLRDVDLAVGEGEFVLLAGATGAGKSTLLGLLNGLVPHFTGGHLEGNVTVAGSSTRTHPPRELAHLVGMVGQDPLAGFVTDTVEEELAYGMEQLAVAPQTMRRRVEETLDLLGIADLRRRPLRTLSGGQQQRVAIGSVLTMHPPILVLDEPTSALDPTAAEEVLATLTRLVHDLGITVVLAEHRMERVIPFADRMLSVAGDGSVRDGAPEAVVRDLPHAPSIVQLGRLAAWEPLPLSVRDARRLAAPLRDRLGSAGPDTRRSAGHGAASSQVALEARGVVVRYGSVPAVSGVDLTLARGSVLALLGRNGSGKSSLLWALQGSGPRQAGTVGVGADLTDPRDTSRTEARGIVGLVPQSATDLLYLETVAEECAAGDADAGAEPGSCTALLERIAPGIPRERHPRDLSEGQQLALVLAVQLVAAPAVLLLDEPTRGLDYAAKDALAAVIGTLAAGGTSIVVATHDVEFVAQVADRVAVLADGELIAVGDPVEVLGGSPAFAPQVTKILGEGWLTVAQVRAALHATAEVTS